MGNKNQTASKSVRQQYNHHHQQYGGCGNNYEMNGHNHNHNHNQNQNHQKENYNKNSIKRHLSSSSSRNLVNRSSSSPVIAKWRLSQMEAVPPPAEICTLTRFVVFFFLITGYI